MNELLSRIELAIKHLSTLDTLFTDKSSYTFPKEKDDYELYKYNKDELIKEFNVIGAFDEIYSQKNRQMKLADIFEYIFLGRCFYAMGTRRSKISNKEKFLKGLLHFINLLMCYESITVNVERRNKFLDKLTTIIPSIAKEENYKSLRKHKGSIGLPSKDPKLKSLNDYFDEFLPKTAGGLWHELIVYCFLLRNNLGYILPLLLHQKIYSKTDHLVPPDYLIITKDRQIFGIEVGSKKEIQSGSFSLKTAIPTATIDTINSRSSDRCPICKNWINFCPYVIDKYSNFEESISDVEVRCLLKCKLYSEKQIVNGECIYSKFSRKETKKLIHTKHKFADGKHYHYKCVLNNISKKERTELIKAKDEIAIKTHLPYYQGLENLMTNE
jgi:hypothetical protein